MKIIFALFLSLLLLSCGRTYTPEEKAYIASIMKSRQEKDDWMKNDPSSPFKRDSLSHFAPLKYFDVDPDFKFTSTLREYPQKDTVIILGTKGEERKTVKYGYVLWNFRGKEIPINVYKGVSRTGQEYYSIWFTDKTTGKTTYHVGRYLDFELNPDKNFLYTIDFNEAYSPYCSYSSSYSCAVPSKDDHIDVEITAGEKSFH
jgi:uncharacterized protein (DUF1684 family)